MNILLVCSGNTCRSPLAEVYLKSRQPGWTVHSAGTHAVSGQAATELAQQVARSAGLDLSAHRARHVREVKDVEFDRVFVMGQSHLPFLEVESAELLSSLRGQSKSVADPYGGELGHYQEAFQEICHYLDGFEPGDA
jgi:protein arginine phosphatase